MSLFIDASAFIAMIAGEDEGARFATILIDERDPLWSAMACWETVSGLRSSYGWTTDQARVEVELIVSQLPFQLVPIGEAERRLALDAYHTFGKGSGHRAKLNMGDCFAYACAKTNGARLLYKGDDFRHTDLA